MSAEYFPNANEIHDYVTLQKSIMHEKRLQILLALKDNSTSWSGLMYKLDIRNPKLLHDHVTILTSSKVIEKDQDGLYRLSKFGKQLTDANLNLLKKSIQFSEDEL